MTVLHKPLKPPLNCAIFSAPASTGGFHTPPLPPSYPLTQLVKRMLRTLAILICLMLYLPVPAGAQPPGDCADPAVPSAELIQELTRWIGAQTGYDITRTLADPPRVSFCDTGQTIIYEDQTLIVDPGLRAAYDLSDRHIYLVLPWDAANPKDVSALLHELIHDVQLINRDWPCVGAPEWQAYKLQETWLAERGIDPGFDWLHIYMYSRCPRDIHPD